MPVYGYRYYAPERGRWPSWDRIGEKGGVNLYGMVGNDPVNRWDVLGLFTISSPESSIDPDHQSGEWKGPGTIDPDDDGPMPPIEFNDYVKIKKPSGTVCCVKSKGNGFTATGTSTRNVDFAWLIGRSCQARCEKAARKGEGEIQRKLKELVQQHFDGAKTCGNQQTGQDEIVIDISGIHMTHKFSDTCNCEVTYNSQRAIAHVKK